MAAGQLSRPGTAYGPCADPCQHTDCAATRRMADSLCRLCRTAIGYETWFYQEESGGYVHATCLLTAQEEARHNA
jgi:hypothetical protein